MSEQQGRVQINIGQLQQSPTMRQNGEEDSGNVVLSQKEDESQMILKRQSPNLMKHKLEVLKKLYQKTVQRRTALGQVDTIIVEKEQQLDGYKTLLQAKQLQIKQDNEAKQKISQKQAQVAGLQNQIQSIRSDNENMAKDTRRVDQLKSEMQSVSQRIEHRNDQARSNLINNRVEQKVSQLRKIVENIQCKRSFTEDVINGSRTKVDSGKAKLETLISQILLQTNSQANSNRLNELQQQQKSVEQQISNRQEELQRVRTELQFISRKQQAAIEVAGQPQQLNRVKIQVQSVKSRQQSIGRQYQQNRQKIKDFQDRHQASLKQIQSQKFRNNQIGQKNKKLEGQKNEIQRKVAQAQSKKPKYQQKVPEELIAMKKRKQQLNRQLKAEYEITLKERCDSDNLVPPIVVENFKAQIAQIYQRNQKFAQLIAQNTVLLQENKVLGSSKETLEWETNPDIKSNEASLQKEEVKSSTLEEDVTELRKKNIQVITKLDQYIKQYPDYKPEKKAKKQEPAPQPTGTRENLQVDKNDKKKKNDKSAQQIPRVVQEQKPALVVPQKNNSVKQESKSPGQGKQKPPKSQPVKKQQARVQQAPKSPQLKLESKQSNPENKQQQAKNKKKKR